MFCFFHWGHCLLIENGPTYWIKGLDRDCFKAFEDWCAERSLHHWGVEIWMSPRGQWPQNHSKDALENSQNSMLSCWLALALRLPLQMWNRAETRARKAWLKSASGDGDPEKYVKTDSGMKGNGKSPSYVVAPLLGQGSTNFLCVCVCVCVCRGNSQSVPPTFSSRLILKVAFQLGQQGEREIFKPKGDSGLPMMFPGKRYSVVGGGWLWPVSLTHRPYSRTLMTQDQKWLAQGHTGRPR